MEAPASHVGSPEPTAGLDAVRLSRYRSDLVLVVDPDEETRALCRQAITIAGHAIREAVDGREALAMALTDPPRLVIAGGRLDGISGYDLCEILRQDRVTRFVPILIVTSARWDEVQRARTAGADAALAKPFGLSAIVAATLRLATDDGARGRDRPPFTALLGHGPGSSRAPAWNAVLSQIDSGPDVGAHGKVDLGVRTDLGRGSGSRRLASRSHVRGKTTSPPSKPPELNCPDCGEPLIYIYSHLGGVSSRYPEQWDWYACTTSCGTFEYRQRTRRVRRIEQIRAT